MAAIASELAGRGHRCTFVHQADAAASIGDARLGFEAVGLTSHPPGELARIVDRLARLNGAFGLQAMIRDVARTTDMLCREAPAVLDRIRVDAIVADQLEAAGGLIAARLGLPLVSVANALMINREPDVPPPFTAWAYARTRWARERNLGGYRVSDWLMGDIHDVIGRWSRAWGLEPRRTIEDCLSPVQVGQLVRELDVPRAALPARFTYTGPLRTALAQEPRLEMHPGDRRPLVFASLGTLQGGRFDIFARIAKACGDLGLRAVIAHGGRLTEAQAKALPGAPIVAPFLPQRRVIARCVLTISHGGMNTVLDALSFGVPLLVIPIAMEQGAIAERIRRASAGEVVSRRWLTASRLRHRIAHILASPSYKLCAEGVAAAIGAAGGARRAAGIVESTVGATLNTPCEALPRAG